MASDLDIPATPPSPKKLSEVRPLSDAKPQPVAEERFRHLVESVSDYGIFLLSRDGFVESWNLGAEKIKGYAPDEIIGKHFSIFYTEDDRARNHPAKELAIAELNGRYEEEGWRVRRNGGRFWANVVITALKSADGTLVGFSKVTRDLTERKAAEDALRLSEEKARLVYESVKDYAIITLDVKGNVTSWNEGAQRIKGYEPREILGKHFSLFYSTEEVASGKCDYELKEAATTGRFEDEGWRLRKDGSKFWANVVITALYDRQRVLQGFSKVTRDVTERKRSEDRLRMANEQLERRVSERTEALQEAIRARDEFLSIASHELRTPMTPLKLQLQVFVSYLKNGRIGILPPERLESMALSIDRSLNRLGKLIDSLLDVARINAGKIQLHPEAVNVREVIFEIVQRFQSEAQQFGSVILFEAGEPILAVLDRLRLEQVAVNIISNAIKYGNRKPITVSLSESEDRVVVKIADHGVGISSENISRIFNRFEQVETPGHTVGLGLGLYITKQILDAQGGQVTVESSVGVGSTFIFTLPLHSQEQKNG